MLVNEKGEPLSETGMPLPSWFGKALKWQQMAASKATVGLDGNLRYPLEYPQRTHLSEALAEAATTLLSLRAPNWWDEHSERYQERINDLEAELAGLRRVRDSFASDGYTEEGYCRVCGKFFTDCNASHAKP